MNPIKRSMWVVLGYVAIASLVGCIDIDDVGDETVTTTAEAVVATPPQIAVAYGDVDRQSDQVNTNVVDLRFEGSGGDRVDLRVHGRYSCRIRIGWSTCPFGPTSVVVTKVGSAQPIIPEQIELQGYHDYREARVALVLPQNLGVRQQLNARVTFPPEVLRPPGSPNPPWFWLVTTLSGCNPDPRRGRPCPKPAALLARTRETCVLLTSGDVRCWGDNDRGTPASWSGSLVRPVATGRIGPDRLTDRDGLVCSREDNTGVVCWGREEGFRRYRYFSTPDPIPYQAVFHDALDIADNGDSLCVVKADRTPTCFDEQSEMQRYKYDGSIDTDWWHGNVGTVPDGVVVSELGLHHDGMMYGNNLQNVHCGIEADGDVVCVSTHYWRDYQVFPLPRIPGPARAIAASRGYMCALLVDGRATCTRMGETPETFVLPGPDRFVELKVATDLDGSYPRSYALLRKADGTVWYWNLWSSGPDPSAPAVQVPGVTNARAISAAEYHACALDTDDRVLCWGHNGYLRLGPTLEPTSDTPIITRLY